MDKNVKNVCVKAQEIYVPRNQNVVGSSLLRSFASKMTVNLGSELL